ncbi:Dolichyl-phosphate-mannose-protein mannosyltransferase [Paenibacillus tianmuensis]|uniref:Dolichyl-phosphate-mannose-protein mannosyltransferase n=1 Tax=Paenibacillus tianmuensis TaxID=624147 RepID=A0A1G4TVQ1_9BACL|nr:hypothetical protein [Paenibacillus tianmuensis]SCW85408.1 Dolichyl-phosphate-mannose-protein mannosyltransferase [Paenibacillus tianmuensis]
MQVTNKYLKLISILIIMLINISLYQWTLKQPLMGDALMHVVDDTQLHKPLDFARIFYLTKNPDYQENNRIQVMNRPIFNELIITFEKKIFSNNLVNMRYITLAVHIVNAVLIFSFINLLYRNIKTALFGSLFFSLNNAYFYGLYEFGLSFSIWLTLFTIISFIFLIKYIRTSSLKYLFLLYFSFFLAIFTKESALTLPFALIVFAIFIIMNAESRFQGIHRVLKALKDKKVWFISLGLILILSLNLFLRYKKLGSILDVHAGIGADVTLFQTFAKILGYFLLAFNLPLNIIPGYMAISIQYYYIPIAIIIILFFGYFFINICKNMIKKNISTYVGLIIFIILLIPIFKVSRNSPYYLDLPLIGIIICVCGLVNFQNISIINKKILYFMLPFILINNLYFQYISTSKDVVWLTKGEKEASQIIEALKALPRNELYEKNIYMLNSYFNQGTLWIFNHGRVGSFLFANLNIDLRKTQVFNLRQDFKKGSTLLDQYYELSENGQLNLKSQSISSVTGFVEIKEGQVSSTYTSISNDNELIEIKGRLKSNVDKNKLSPIQLEFERKESEIIKKTYSNYADGPTSINQEFSVYSLVPHNSSQVKLTIPDDLRNQFEALEVHQYKLIIDSNNIEDIGSRTSLINNPSFEKGVESWIGLKETQIIQNAHTGNYGAKVGPGTANSAFQTIAVKPEEDLVISAWAKSINNSNAVGRLQINWADQNGNFIEAYIKIFNVSEKYEYQLAVTKPPQNAEKALVYISPHDETSEIVYDDVNVYQK